AKSDSANELAFSNNSSLRVATSLRSGTLQYLHISEHGKICAKYPEKAKEIRTGALNTVEQGNMIFIESTAEGQEGDFHDMCQRAQSRARMKARLTPLDFKFMFFPWWKHPEYRLDPDGVVIPGPDQDYYDKLEGEGINLDAAQMAWYTKKMETQQEDMKREYPSTPKEAFEASIEGAYYSKQFILAEKQGRIGPVPHDESLPVHTFWDIGHDTTSIWFAQFSGPFIRVIDYEHDSEEGLPHYVKILDRKPYLYGKHWGPHDIRNREWGGNTTRLKTAKKLGIQFKVAPNISIDDGIDAVRALFPRIYFDEANCADGLKGLRAYRKEWDTDRATWKSNPRHDWASHPADAFRYLCLSYKEDMGEAIEEKPQFILDQPMNKLMEQHFSKERKGRQMGRYG
ncbi:MAG: terminase, partial [Hyphomicrobium sp.]